MRQSVKLPVIFSYVFLADDGPVDVPEYSAVRRVAATSSCIAVPTYPEIDGETEIFLSGADNMPAGPTAYDDVLDTPNKFFGVWTGEHVQLLGQATTYTRTRVRIWINHPTMPDRIEIVVG